MRLIATIEDPRVVRQILTHLGDVLRVDELVVDVASRFIPSSLG